MGLFDIPALTLSQYLADRATLTLSAQQSASPLANPINPSTNGTGYNGPRVNNRNGVFSVYSQNSVAYFQNSINNGASISYASKEIDFYGHECAIQFRNAIAGGSYLWVWVDGVPQTSAPVQMTAATLSGQPYWLTITFPTVRTRRVRIFSFACDLGAFSYTDGVGYQAAPTRPTERKIAILGDSWAGGALSVRGPDLWAFRVPVDLGMEGAQCGQGSTGFTTAGTGSPKTAYTNAERLAKIVAFAPDYVYIHASQNDSGSTTGAVSAAVTSVLAYLDTNLPSAKVIVGGMPRINANPSAGYLGLHDAGRDAALSAPNCIGFIDNIRDAIYGEGGSVIQAATGNPWLTGTGRVGAETNDGTNADLYVGSDAAHLTAQGHAYWTSRLTPALNRVIAAAAE